MRRKDRAVTDPADIEEIISRCDCCRLGLTDGQEVYIVPMNFGYVRTGTEQILYFHCAKEGRKLDLLAQNPRVGFEMDASHALRTADIACGHSFYYESVIGTGTVAVVDDVETKQAGLAAVMQHYTGRTEWSFDEKLLQRTIVLRLTIDSLSAKRHSPPNLSV